MVGAPVNPANEKDVNGRGLNDAERAYDALVDAEAYDTDTGVVTFKANDDV
jgi:hypothetical protein